MNPKVLGLDIGGSAIKAAVVDITNGRLQSEPATIKLGKYIPPDALLAAVDACRQQFDWHGPFGVGYPGVIKNGITLSAAHLDKSFIGHNWLADLKSLSDQPIVLLNDADAAGLAEIRFGAGQSRSHPGSGTVVVVTLGTGIGTALFHGGRLFPNTEFGHMQMGESEAEEQAAGSIRTGEGLTWEEYGERVNRFLIEMERLLSPDLIILGGGVCENFARFCTAFTVQTEVVPASLGNTAGLIGAALAVFPSR